MEQTPTAVRAARIAMSEAERFLRDMALTLRWHGIPHAYPDLAELTDAATNHTDALRNARHNL